jgi:hypothetical protein
MATPALRVQPERLVRAAVHFSILGEEQQSAVANETPGHRLYEGGPFVKPCVRSLTSQLMHRRVS